MNIIAADLGKYNSIFCFHDNDSREKTTAKAPTDRSYSCTKNHSRHRRMTRGSIVIRYLLRLQSEMDIHKATYSHDHQKIAEFLDNGGVLDAAGLCNLVLFDSKSETL